MFIERFFFLFIAWQQKNSSRRQAPPAAVDTYLPYHQCFAIMHFSIGGNQSYRIAACCKV